MTEIKKTDLRLKKPPCNSEDDVPPRNVEHPEKEGKKRKIDDFLGLWKKAPEEGQVQDKRPGSRIRFASEIHPGCKVWVYSKTKRKPGVVEKVNIVKAIVNMANAEGKMTDYSVHFKLIGLRDE